MHRYNVHASIDRLADTGLSVGFRQQNQTHGKSENSGNTNNNDELLLKFAST